MKTFWTLACVAMLGGALGAGCATQTATVRGAAPSGAPSGAPVRLAQARAAHPGTVLTVRGAMLEKCPVSGCWFILHDGSGTLRIDTKTAGFTVGHVPLHSTLTVQGKVVASGGEKQLQASGIRY